MGTGTCKRPVLDSWSHSFLVYGLFLNYFANFSLREELALAMTSGYQVHGHD